MKTVQLIKIEEDLEDRDIPTPEPKSNEVLIRIKAAGICHSDVHYRNGVSSVGYFPIALGHEVAGEVEKLGSNVSDFEVGDRVCLNYMITCGRCKYCVQGTEQFCVEGKMIGNAHVKNTPGTHAEIRLEKRDDSCCEDDESCHNLKVCVGIPVAEIEFIHLSPVSSCF